MQKTDRRIWQKQTERARYYLKPTTDDVILNTISVANGINLKRKLNQIKKEPPNTGFYSGILYWY